MTRHATVELRDLHLAASIGTYGPDDVVPDVHILDLTLIIAPDLVQISTDDMASVFDYDPLIARIDALARAQGFATQEYVMSLIVAVCADYPQIEGVEIALRKAPVLAGTGSLGVRLSLGAADLAQVRAGLR